MSATRRKISCNKVISLDTTVTEYNRYKPRTSEKMHKTVNETYANLDVFILRCTVLPKTTLKNYCKYEPRDKSRRDICQSHTINSVQLYGVHVPARNSGRWNYRSTISFQSSTSDVRQSSQRSVWFTVTTLVLLDRNWKTVIKKCLVLQKTLGFITVFTVAHIRNLSWARLIHFTLHPISLWSILLLSSHLPQRLQNYVFQVFWINFPLLSSSSSSRRRCRCFSRFINIQMRLAKAPVLHCELLKINTEWPLLLLLLLLSQLMYPLLK